MASPVSSASRASLHTGRFPIEVGINSFLSNYDKNEKLEQEDYLSTSHLSIAKILKNAGYSTALIGKWHLGGGHGVNNAPSIYDYGYDYYVSTWESPDPDPKLTSADLWWSKDDEVRRYNRTEYFIDKALDYLKKNKEKAPCFINLNPDDMHNPWVYDEGCYDYYEAYQNGKPHPLMSEENFMRVLENYDKQIGRFVYELDKMGIMDNTLIIFMSDNGPKPHFEHKRTNNLRGAKNSLYEGGINVPFIVYWPGKVKDSFVDNTSVISSVDILPSICSIINIEIPHGDISGEDMSSCFMGIPKKRSKDLYWAFGWNNEFGIPPMIKDRSLCLSIRTGDYKFYTDINQLKDDELYDLNNDPYEENNIAVSNKELCDLLKPKLVNWYKSTILK